MSTSQDIGTSITNKKIKKVDTNANGAQNVQNSGNESKYTSKRVKYEQSSFMKGNTTK